MATVTKDGMTLTVGRDFVDCVTSRDYKTRGRVVVANVWNREWDMQIISTLDCQETEKAIRKIAMQDGVRIVVLEYQAI